MTCVVTYAVKHQNPSSTTYLTSVIQHQAPQSSSLLDHVVAPRVYRVLFVRPVVVPPGNPIIEARDEVLSEGNETEMTCTAMSSKPAATIRWMKGDKELPGRSAPAAHRDISCLNTMRPVCCVAAAAAATVPFTNIHSSVYFF